jgi:hypothetical protein
VARHQGPQQAASLAARRDDCLDILGPVASVDVTTEIFGRLEADPKVSARRVRFLQALTERRPEVVVQQEHPVVPELRAAELQPESHRASDATAHRVSALSLAEVRRVARCREVQRTERQARSRERPRDASAGHRPAGQRQERRMAERPGSRQQDAARQQESQTRAQASARKQARRGAAAQRQPVLPGEQACSSQPSSQLQPRLP